MPDIRTEITELVTGLGMLGHSGIDEALALRPSEMVSVSPEQWNQLDLAYRGGKYAYEFESSFANGAAFLEAHDGLRGRRPAVIEWKGPQKNPGDEALPVDLRIDHVFLVSCKYLSRVLHNVSPARLFKTALRSGLVDERADWFAHVAAVEYQALYELTLRHCQVEGVPLRAMDLATSDRKRLREAYPKTWAPEVEAAYAVLCSTVSAASAEHWKNSMTKKSDGEAMLWRLLRLGPAPYFVLGTAKADDLRLRIATPWDWRQHFRLRSFDVFPQSGGQPRVGWKAVVEHAHSGEHVEVDGHIEVRWSHGRFGGWPEAKVYLDTPHADVPGYFRIT
jgi:hypothetical protein